MSGLAFSLVSTVMKRCACRSSSLVRQQRAQTSGELSGEQQPRALARFLTMTLHGVGIMSRGGASRQAAGDSVRVALSLLKA